MDSALVGSHGSKLGTEAGVNFHSMQKGDLTKLSSRRCLCKMTCLVEKKSCLV